MSETVNDTTAAPAGAAEHDAEAAELFAPPGFGWLDDASCAQVGMNGPSALAPFLESSRHVVDAATLARCQRCPVRPDCITHAYVGGPRRTPVRSGYLGGFSA